MVLKKEREYVNGPMPLDESWWTAVLEDVEARHTNHPQVSRDQKDEKEVSSRRDEAEKNGREQEEPSPINPIQWEQVQKLYEHDQVISLDVASHNRGGLLVEGEGIQGFVPASHLVGLSQNAAKKDRDDFLSPYVGQTLQLKVIECDQERGRIVFSERAAQTDSGSRLELLKTLSEGDHKQGRVTTITDFGVFVDLGGVEGLIHISELSWGRVCHPNEVVTLGDEIEVYILSIDRERSRVALSLKQLRPNPWDTIHSHYHQGQITKAVITNIVPFGAFARLEDGLDGLIHTSEFGERAGRKDIEAIISEGQEVEVCILHIDSNQQRLGLSLQANNKSVM
jgi:small subunit ribosomal protein S1